MHVCVCVCVLIPCSVPSLQPTPLSTSGLRASVGRIGLAPSASPIPTLPGQPDINVVVVEVPSAVASEFKTRAEAHPDVAQHFNPNFRPHDAPMLEQCAMHAAVMLHEILQAHAPSVLSMLSMLEQSYKGVAAEHAPHVLLRGLEFGPVTVLPTSDDPRQDPAGFHAQGLPVSELFMLGLNALLGFARFPVSGEKGGVPVHHHVPIAKHASSGTSVSFKSPIAVHVEDVHYQHLYGHFTLYGKLGNEQCLTPLMSMASFLSLIPERVRERVVCGMRLHYLHRPGAGRVDGAAERLIAPLIDSDWAGRTYLRFNGADYHSILSGEHIYRHYTLEPSMYASAEEHALACETLEVLRSVFSDVQPLLRQGEGLWPLSVRTGDLLLVSNKVGPHSRTAFSGPRYVQRLYSSYAPDTWWCGANRLSMPERVCAFRRMLSGGAAVHAACPITCMLGRLEALVGGLRYMGLDPTFLGERACAIATTVLAPHLAELHGVLVAHRAVDFEQWSTARRDVIVREGRELVAVLSLLVMSMTKDNWVREVERVASVLVAEEGSLGRTVSVSVQKLVACFE